MIGPMLALLLACPFIPIDEHQARVAALPGEIDPRIDEVEGGLMLRCGASSELRLYGTVAGAWADQDLEVQVAIDDQPFIPFGSVHSGPVAGGRAVFEFAMPSGQLEVPACELDDLCSHDLKLSLRALEQEDSTVFVGAVRRPGGGPRLADGFVTNALGGVESLRDVGRLFDPPDALYVGDWPGIGASFEDPWVAAGGDPHRYYVNLFMCPPDAGYDDIDCVVNYAVSSPITFGGDFGVETSAIEFAEAICVQPVRPPGSWWVVVRDLECDAQHGFQLTPLNPVRFVRDDCDTDEVTSAQGDCADADPDVHPEAREVACDGVDANCSGDDFDGPEAATLYRDADGDRYGLDTETIVGCTPPFGYASKGGDCDDGDPLIFPSADDPPADGSDRDCDGND
jgi:hypothetical protein